MPIYEYRCEQGHLFEVRQRMADDPITSCATCEAPVQRVFSPVAVHFKGSGFYNTDYGKRKRGGSGEGSEGDGGSSSGDDGKKLGDGSSSGDKSSSGESKGSSGDSGGSGASGSSGDSGSKTSSTSASSS